MARSVTFATGAFLAAVGVSMGAFGAHALSSLPPLPLSWWHTATQYLFVGAIGLMMDGLFDREQARLRWPALAFLVGTFCFSGSLYAMALGLPRWLGMVTPVGGLLLIAGYLLIAMRALRRPR